MNNFLSDNERDLQNIHIDETVDTWQCADDIKRTLQKFLTSLTQDWNLYDSNDKIFILIELSDIHISIYFDFFLNLLDNIFFFFSYTSLLMNKFPFLWFHFLIAFKKIKRVNLYISFFFVLFLVSLYRDQLIYKSTYTQVYTVCSMHRPLMFSFINFISVISISHENTLKYFAENSYWYAFSDICVSINKVYNISFDLFEQCLTDNFFKEHYILVLVILVDFRYHNCTILNKKVNLIVFNFLCILTLNLLYTKCFCNLLIF